jgi:hypothetical protein
MVHAAKVVARILYCSSVSANGSVQMRDNPHPAPARADCSEMIMDGEEHRDGRTIVRRLTIEDRRFLSMLTRSFLTIATLVGGLALGPAVQAAPMAAQPGVAGNDIVERAAMHHHRHRMHRHHSTRHERRMRRMNMMRHGHPNAKNPALRGHQQNLGGTTGGPRY